MHYFYSRIKHFNPRSLLLIICLNLSNLAIAAKAEVCEEVLFGGHRMMGDAATRYRVDRGTRDGKAVRLVYFNEHAHVSMKEQEDIMAQVERELAAENIKRRDESALASKAEYEARVAVAKVEAERKAREEREAMLARQAEHEREVAAAKAEQGKRAEALRLEYARKQKYYVNTYAALTEADVTLDRGTKNRTNIYRKYGPTGSIFPLLEDCFYPKVGGFLLSRKCKPGGAWVLRMLPPSNVPTGISSENYSAYRKRYFVDLMTEIARYQSERNIQHIHFEHVGYNDVDLEPMVSELAEFISLVQEKLKMAINAVQVDWWSILPFNDESISTSRRKSIGNIFAGWITSASSSIREKRILEKQGIKAGVESDGSITSSDGRPLFVYINPRNIQVKDELPKTMESMSFVTLASPAETLTALAAAGSAVEHRVVPSAPPASMSVGGYSVPAAGAGTAGWAMPAPAAAGAGAAPAKALASDVPPTLQATLGDTPEDDPRMISRKNIGIV